MKRKRLLIICPVMALVVSLVVALTIGCAPAPEKAEIRIGITTSLSGDAAAWGIAHLRALELVVDKYNAEGGIYIKEAGKKLPIRIIAYDDMYLPDQTTINTKKLCYEDKVIAVLTMGDEPFIAAAPICRDAKVIHWQSPWTLDYPNPDFPLQFSCMQTVQDYAPCGVAFYHELYPEVKNVGCIARNFYGGYVEQAIFKEVAERIGMKWVFDDVFDWGTTDFSAMILKAMDRGLECLLTSSAPPDALGAIIKQSRDLGYKGDFVHLVAHTTVMAEIAGAENIEGSLYSIGELGEPFPPNVKAYAEAYLEKYGPPLDPTAVTLWLVMDEPLFQAIERAGTLDVLAIAKVLETETFDTIYGDLYFAGEEFYGLGHQAFNLIPVSVARNGMPVTIAWFEPVPYPASKDIWAPWRK